MGGRGSSLPAPLAARERMPLRVSTRRGCACVQRFYLRGQNCIIPGTSVESDNIRRILSLSPFLSTVHRAPFNINMFLLSFELKLAVGPAYHNSNLSTYLSTIINRPHS